MLSWNECLAGCVFRIVDALGHFAYAVVQRTCVVHWLSLAHPNFLIAHFILPEFIEASSVSDFDDISNNCPDYQLAKFRFLLHIKLKEVCIGTYFIQLSLAGASGPMTYSAVLLYLYLYLYL